MHRSAILKTLDEYQPRSSPEVEIRDRFVQFVQTTPTCFERTHETGHVTGSSFVLSPDKSCLLLNFHAKLQKWFALGGHADGCSDVLDVAHREAIEESGLTKIQLHRITPIDLDIHEIPANKKESAHYHYDVRFVFHSQTSDFVCSHESKELTWVLLEEVSRYTEDPSILRVIEKLRLDGRMEKSLDNSPAGEAQTKAGC